MLDNYLTVAEREVDEAHLCGQVHRCIRGLPIFGVANDFQFGINAGYNLAQGDGNITGLVNRAAFL